jgi:hypothetical protein
MGLVRILIELFNPVDLLNGRIFSLKFNVYTIFYLPFKTSFKWGQILNYPLYTYFITYFPAFFHTGAACYMQSHAGKDSPVD